MMNCEFEYQNCGHKILLQGIIDKSTHLHEEIPWSLQGNETHGIITDRLTEKSMIEESINHSTQACVI